MIIIVFLLCISLAVAIFFLIAYVWGVKTGQFDDDFSPAHRIFYDDKVNTKGNINSSEEATIEVIEEQEIHDIETKN